MSRFKGVWSKLRSSKFGWGILISGFALAFAIVASLFTATLSLPALISEDFKYTDELISLIFPLVSVGLSFLIAKRMAKRNGASISKTLGWRMPKKNALWLTPLLLVLYVFLLVVSMLILQALSPNLAGQEQEIAETVSSSANWSLVIMAVSVGVFTPIAEETFFRGLLLSLYSRRLKIATSIALVSILFGLAHGQVNVGIDTFIFGLVLGILTWKTESIYPAISQHMLKHCLAIIALIST